LEFFLKLTCIVVPPKSYFSYSKPTQNNDNSISRHNIEELSNILKDVGSGPSPKKIKQMDRKENQRKNSKEKKNVNSYTMDWDTDRRKTPDINPKLISQILNNKTSNESSYKPSETSITNEHKTDSNENTTKFSKGSQSPLSNSSSNIQNYLKKNKSILRTITLKLVDNKKNSILQDISISRSLHEKIMAPDFISDCLANANNKDLDLVYLKLVMINKLGIFIRIINEDDISEILKNYLERKDFLLYLYYDNDYIFDDHQVTIAIHFCKNNFTGDVQIPQENYLKPPFIIKHNTLQSSPGEFIKNLKTLLKENFGESYMKSKGEGNHHNKF
jgi:hypothetical protein